MPKSSLKELFKPSSLAVIGASSNPAKIGHEVLRNIIESGYKGRIFPVNPRTPEILGLKTYTSVEIIPVPVDLAIVAIPSAFVPGVMKECAEKGVKAAIIISGGFREVGKEGKKLEESLIEIAVKSGIRIIGPNCQGVNVPGSGLAATFGGFARKPGPIAVITQSGTVGAAVQCWAEKEGLGISALTWETRLTSTRWTLSSIWRRMTTPRSSLFMSKASMMDECSWTQRYRWVGPNR